MATILVVASAIGILLTPFHAPNLHSGIVRASGTNGVVANYSIVGLPRHTVNVGEPIVIPQKSTSGNAYFQIVRTSGVRDVVVGYSNSNGVSASISGTNGNWSVAGFYEYRFFMDGAPANLNSTPNDNYFHSFDVTVMQNNFAMSLPTNSENIVPNIVVPGTAITLPLPTSFVDRHGRDLFEVRRDGERQPFVPYLSQLEVLYPAVTAALNLGNVEDQFERLHYLQMAVFADTRISFFGVGAVNNALGNANDTLVTMTISGATITVDDAVARRTFTPTTGWPTNHAEYIFRHNNSDVTVASLQTNNIIVDNIGRDFNNVRDNIRFDSEPSVDFVPSSLRQNVEITLPRPTVSLSRETDRDSNAFNPVNINADTFANYTFIRAQVRTALPNGGWGPWRDAQRPEGGYFNHITDFTFIPTETNAEYRFWYYTTTIFGPGFDFIGGGHIVTVEGRRFMRFNPFAPDPRFHVRPYHTAAPQMVWTDEFDLDDNNPVTRPDGGSYLGGTPIEFEFAIDRSRYMPGRGTNARTQIANDVILQDAGDLTSHRNEHLLRIPALLGHDDTGNTRSGNLTYSLTISRFLPDQPSATTITFASNTNNPSGNNFFWDNTSELVIDFSTMDFTNGYRGTDANDGTLTAFETNTVARYTITVIVRDVRHGDQWWGSSSSENFSFNVVGTNDYRMHEDAPTFHGGIHRNRINYEINDTISFRQVNVSDPFTDTANIDVQYFLHYTSLGLTTATTNIAAGEQFINITEEATLVGGNVQLPLILDGTDVAYDLLNSIPSNGMLRVNIIAVARNYFALKNDFQFTTGFPIAEQHPGISVETAEIRIFGVNYGSAVNIFGASGEWDDTNWASRLVDANTGPGTENSNFEQNLRVYLPQFLMNYAYGQDSHRSSVSLSVAQPNTNDTLTLTVGQNGQDGSGRQLTIPAATDDTDYFNPNPAQNDFSVISTMLDNDEDERIYFIPRQSGVHTLTILVSNNGRNMSVFVATINIRGIAHVTPAFVGGVTEMRVGESFPLPSIFVTVNGEEFFANDRGELVGEHYSTGDDVIIGTYDILGGNWRGNNFAPGRADRFTFEYVISINIEALREDVGLNITGTTMILRREHVINVRPLNANDLIINLMRDDFNFLRTQALANTATSYLEVERALANNTTETMRVDAVNFPAQFTSPANAQGGSFSISDAELMSGLRPVTGVANRYEYGFIFLPDFQAVMAPGLIPPPGFSNQVREGSYITVQGPIRGGSQQPGATQFLLDTRNEDTVQHVYAPGIMPGTEQKLFFFQPVGQLDRVGTTDDFTRTNPNIFVDGEYVVTYSATFQGVTTTVVFRISIGDTAMARIYFDTVDQDRIFNTVYTVGDTFTLDTYFVNIDANNSRTNFDAFFVAYNIRFEATGPLGPIVAGDNWDAGNWRATYVGAEAISNAGRQVFQFNLRTAGEYHVTLRITSEAGVPSTFTARFIVEEPPVDRTLDTNTVWAIILIILASGILLGVVIYFIKTGRDTKFAGANAKGKKGKKAEGTVEAEKLEKPDQV